MPTITLNNGVVMPVLGFGTRQHSPDPGALEQSVETAIRVGYRHIDTAYSFHNETSVGAVLQRMLQSGEIKREDLFVSTKLPRIAHSRDQVWYFLQKSLEDLRLNYVDLYLVHFPVPGKPEMVSRGSISHFNERDVHPLETDFIDILETWAGMEDVYDGRLAKAIGVSNFNCKQLKRVYDHARIKPSNLQIECHLYMAQKEVFNFCKALGISVTAYSPLGLPDNPLHGILVPSGFSFGAPAPKNPLQDPTVLDMAKSLQRSPAQVVLRYLVQRGFAVVPRSENPDHIRENFQIFDFELDRNQVSVLEGLNKNLRLFKYDENPQVVQHPEYPFRSMF